MEASYVLGIDLGTTNSVFAYTAIDAEQPLIQLLEIPQLVDVHTVQSSTTLPSFMDLASEHETGEGAYDLPWRSACDFAVGELARRRANR